MSNPKHDKTPRELMMDAIENITMLTQHANAIAEYKRTMYLSYTAAGFTETQALELIKGSLL